MRVNGKAGEIYPWHFHFYELESLGNIDASKVDPP